MKIRMGTETDIKALLFLLRRAFRPEGTHGLCVTIRHPSLPADGIEVVVDSFDYDSDGLTCTWLIIEGVDPSEREKRLDTIRIPLNGEADGDWTDGLEFEYH